jgi:hypothetical protein
VPELEASILSHLNMEQLKSEQNFKKAIGCGQQFG